MAAKAYLKKHGKSALSDSEMKAMHSDRRETISRHGSKSEIEDKLLERDKHLHEAADHADGALHAARAFDEQCQQHLEAVEEQTKSGWRGKKKKEKKEKKKKEKKDKKGKKDKTDTPSPPVSDHASPEHDHAARLKALQDIETQRASPMIIPNEYQEQTEYEPSEYQDAEFMEPDPYLDVSPKNKRKSPPEKKADKPIYDMYNTPPKSETISPSPTSDATVDKLGRETPFATYGEDTERTALLPPDLGVDNPKQKGGCCTIL